MRQGPGRGLPTPGSDAAGDSVEEQEATIKDRRPPQRVPLPIDSPPKTNGHKSSPDTSERSRSPNDTIVDRNGTKVASVLLLLLKLKVRLTFAM